MQHGDRGKSFQKWIQNQEERGGQDTGAVCSQALVVRQTTGDRVCKYKEGSRRGLIVNQLWVLQEHAGPRAGIWWMPSRGESRLRKMAWC